MRHMNCMQDVLTLMEQDVLIISLRLWKVYNGIKEVFAKILVWEISCFDDLSKNMKRPEWTQRN